MTTPNETRTPRPNFWLRAIEVRKHELTREYRTSLGATARNGVSDEDYATTMATLEKMARNLGWSEDQHRERPFGRGFGGHRHPRQFDGHSSRGHGPRHPFADQAPAETPES
jgi:hypothetical protein